MSKRYLLGYDIGSSSVKATLLEAESGQAVASATSPSTEMPMQSKQAGWAEQDPAMWWEHLGKATASLKASSGISPDTIEAIGISYQMHGLVVVDKDQNILRPSIIWCDSRAVSIGEQAFQLLGSEYCLAHFLNSPGNFTASKLKWVRDHEPSLFEKIHKIMLPGDYIAMKMSGEINTTVSGLSEGILWDFKEGQPAQSLLDHYGISSDLLPDHVPTFGEQSRLSAEAATELGLAAGTPICYRAGDQPNNAFSLNVLNAGEIAATAGTSGVVYGINDKAEYDPASRVNTFVHVNHALEAARYGVLLCINGTGIQNSWLRHNVGQVDYEKMNELAASVPVGADGVVVLPFGNGAERVLENRELGGQIHGLNFNRHTQAHLLRAAQEGIVYALHYGMEVMKGMGISIEKVRAGHANMFLSPLFRETFANISGAVIELYDTDGAQGAARGAGVGSGFYANFTEAFQGLKTLSVIEPTSDRSPWLEAYNGWEEVLKKNL